MKRNFQQMNDLPEVYGELIDKDAAPRIAAEATGAWDEPAARFTCDEPRPPLYVPIIRAERFPVFVHYPVLTPDNGVIMCTTEADQYRVAYDLNRLNDEVETLREELRISRQSEKEAWRSERDFAGERSALQAKIDALMFEFCPEDMTPEQRANWCMHQRCASQTDHALMFGEQLAESAKALLVAIKAEDAARDAWHECGCGTPEFERWSHMTAARRKRVDELRADVREFLKRSANAQIGGAHGG